MSNKPDGTKKKNNQSQKPVAQKKPAPVKIKGAIPSFTPRVPKSPVQLTVPTVAVNELILGNVATGHNVAIGDATFGIMDSGHKLTLVTASTGELAKFSGKAPHVYITVDDLVMGKYRPRLTGKWGDQQVAMWQHICDAIGNDGLDALEKRLNRDREARRELFKAEHEATEKAAMYVGENIEVWERAVTGSDAITTAFTDMTADTAVEVTSATSSSRTAQVTAWSLGSFTTRVSTASRSKSVTSARKLSWQAR